MNAALSTAKTLPTRIVSTREGVYRSELQGRAEEPYDRACSASPFVLETSGVRLAGKRFWRRWGRVLTLSFLLVVFGSLSAAADPFDDSPPEWERLLWGGTIGPEDIAGTNAGREVSPSLEPTAPREQESEPALSGNRRQGSGDNLTVPGREIGPLTPVSPAPAEGSTVRTPGGEDHADDYPAPFRPIALKNIPPLYRSPELPGEGIWKPVQMPAGLDQEAVIFRTSYRPSAEYPNAIVHMLLFDMTRLSVKLYLGSAEPGGSRATSIVPPEDRPRLLAITNALWKHKHAGEGGTVFQGNVLRPLAAGMATLAIYRDDSVDVLEWNEGIPIRLVRDAKQLRHLIVKDGKVVNTVIRAGELADAEIGLGYLLAEEQPAWTPQWYGLPAWRPSAVSYGPDWFIATRSAFGVREDGHLVFAIGHHISTKDLAKALVLAGCERAIHADANPHNVVGNLYSMGADGRILSKDKLSPEQKSYTLDRYVEKSYTSDFFAFFLKRIQRSAL